MQLSAWQAIALQHFAADAVDNLPSEERAAADETAVATSHAAALDRASFLKAFGIDEVTFSEVVQASLLETSPACAD